MFEIVDLRTDTDLDGEFATEEAALWYARALADDVPWGVYSPLYGRYVAIVFKDQVWRPS